MSSFWFWFAIGALGTVVVPAAWNAPGEWALVLWLAVFLLIAVAAVLLVFA